jgi:hypothetical protein
MSENIYKDIRSQNPDIFTNYIASQDWTKRFKDSQHIDENYFYKPHFNVVNSHYKNINESWIHQYKVATGFGAAATLTKLGFAYFGGLLQARKQFITNPIFFFNHYYNWMVGLKYILAGYVIGTFVSSFTFGQPYLLEDLIRARFRGMTVRPFMQRGYIPM